MQIRTKLFALLGALGLVTDSYGMLALALDRRSAAAAVDEELEAFLHLWCLNRGVLLTPFHNMALFCPAHTEADVDRHTEVFGEALAALEGG